MTNTLDYMADWCEELRLRVLKATGVNLTPEELYEVAVQTSKKVREKEHGAKLSRHYLTDTDGEGEYGTDPHV